MRRVDILHVHRFGEVGSATKGCEGLREKRRNRKKRRCLLTGSTMPARPSASPKPRPLQPVTTARLALTATALPCSCLAAVAGDAWGGSSAFASTFLGWWWRLR